MLEVRNIERASECTLLTDTASPSCLPTCHMGLIRPLLVGTASHDDIQVLHATQAMREQGGAHLLQTTERFQDRRSNSGKGGEVVIIVHTTNTEIRRLLQEDEGALPDRVKDNIIHQDRRLLQSHALRHRRSPCILCRAQLRHRFDTLIVIQCSKRAIRHNSAMATFRARRVSCARKGDISIETIRTITTGGMRKT